MKGFFALVFVICWAQLSGQITITNSIFPQAGDFQYTSRDTAALGASVTPPSSGAQSWKFTAFQPWQADTVAVIDAALGGASASFPDAEIVYPVFGGEGYFDNTGDSLELLGFFGDPGIGISFLVEPTSTNVILATPITYGDTFQDDFSFVQTIDPDDFPELAPFLPSFPPIDSIRAIYFSHREDTVDAWGSMTTHLGTYDVLRAKSVSYNNLAIEFKTFGFWVDPSTIGIEIPFAGMDTAITYNFLNDVEKTQIVSINENTDGSISSVTYLVDPDLVTSIDILPGSGLEMDVFPNPASVLINIRIKDPSAERYELRLYNASGQLVRTRNDLSGNGEVNTISIEGFPSGPYILNLLDESGFLLEGRKIIVRE